MEKVDIVREFDATHINQIINHPDIRPWMGDGGIDKLNLQPVLDNEKNILLMGEHGGCLFTYIFPGVYEVHTQILPEGRGEWAVRLVHTIAHWLFTRTDAYEVLTRVPREHKGARQLADQIYFKFEFTPEMPCVCNGKSMPVDVYSMRIQDWILKAPFVVERGMWFHKRAKEESEKIGLSQWVHEGDENHHRYVGAAVEMVMSGQTEKSLFFYNRWAVISRHTPAYVVSLEDRVIKIDPSVSGFNCKFTDNDIEVIPC